MSVELLVLVAMVVLARLIPPSAFGVFALAIIVQELAAVVPGEGIGGALVQRRTVTREHLQTGLALSLAVGAVLAVIVLIVAAAIVQPIFGADAAIVVAATTPALLLGAILALPSALLRRRLEFRRIAMLEVAQTVMRVVVSILLAAVFGLDAMALVLGGLAGTFTIVVLACIFAPVPLPRWRSQAARDILPYGLPAGLTSIIWTAFRNGDYAIVGARLGTTQAGLYWRGYQLGVEYQRKASGMLAQIAFPMLSRTFDADQMYALRQRMASVATVAVFPAIALLIVLAPVLVPWLFGDQWVAAVLPTQILAGGGAVMLLTDITGSVLMASGRARAVLVWAVAHFVVYAGAVLVVARFGLAAVCAAAVASHAVFLVFYYCILVHRRTERALPLLWGDVRAALLSSVALVAAGWPVYLVCRAEGVPAVPLMFLVACAGMIAYLTSLKLLFPAALRDLTSLARRVVPSASIRTRLRRAPLPANR